MINNHKNPSFTNCLPIVSNHEDQPLTQPSGYVSGLLPKPQIIPVVKYGKIPVGKITTCPTTRVGQPYFLVGKTTSRNRVVLSQNSYLSMA